MTHVSTSVALNVTDLDRYTTGEMCSFLLKVAVVSGEVILMQSPFQTVCAAVEKVSS